MCIYIYYMCELSYIYLYISVFVILDNVQHVIFFFCNSPIEFCLNTHTHVYMYPVNWSLNVNGNRENPWISHHLKMYFHLFFMKLGTGSCPLSFYWICFYISTPYAGSGPSISTMNNYCIARRSSWGQAKVGQWRDRATADHCNGSDLQPFDLEILREAWMKCPVLDSMLKVTSRHRMPKEYSSGIQTKMMDLLPVLSHPEQNMVVTHNSWITIWLAKCEALAACASSTGMPPSQACCA